MYLLPSTSMRMAPSASLMKTGVPPTPLKARTGEETPPGMRVWARAKAAVELTVVRAGVGIERRILGRECACANSTKNPHPDPLPAYREREKNGAQKNRG